MQHLFRFGVVCGAFPDASAWRAQARRIEHLGYSTVLVPDGFAVGFDPLLVLAAAADATTTLRVGTYVINNDLRHPALLAKGIATLDLLYAGRVEFGIGAGYREADYRMGAIEYDSAGIRISRMEEAVQLARQLFTQGSVDFHGKYVNVGGMPGLGTAQKPYPPIFIGGGGKRMLSVAAREADIVGIHGMNGPHGMEMSDTTPQAIEQKVEWVREAAGDRFDALELACTIFSLSLGDGHRQAGDSVHSLAGSVEAVVDELEARRERFGFSYYQVRSCMTEMFAPVVARLSGK